MARKTTKLGKFESLEAKKPMTADMGLDHLSVEQVEVSDSVAEKLNVESYDIEFHVNTDANHAQDKSGTATSKQWPWMVAATDSALKQRPILDLSDEDGDGVINQAVDSVFADGIEEARTGYSDVKRVMIKIGSAPDTAQTQIEIPAEYATRTYKML